MKRSEIVKGGRYVYNDNWGQYGFSPYRENDFGSQECEVLDTAAVFTPTEERLAKRRGGVRPTGVLVKIKRYGARKFSAPEVVPLKALRSSWSEYKETREAVEVAAAERGNEDRKRKALARKVEEALVKRYPDHGFYLTDTDALRNEGKVDLDVLADLLGVKTLETA